MAHKKLRTQGLKIKSSKKVTTDAPVAHKKMKTRVKNHKLKQKSYYRRSNGAGVGVLNHGSSDCWEKM